MGYVIFLIFAAMTLAIQWIVRSERRRMDQQNAAWKLVAGEFGLEFTPQPPPLQLVVEEDNGPRIRGICDGFTVDIRGIYQKLTVAGLEPSLRLTPREGADLLELLGAPLRDPELLVGDPSFDQQVLVRSYVEAQTFAALDRETREAISRAMRQGIRVVNGELVSSTRGLSSADALTEMLSLALDLARRMSLPGEKIPARLSSLATEDPAPRVRTRALASLIALYPDAPETARARAQVGQEQVEPMLLAHLQESPRGQGVVFDALGAIGSLPTVEPLLQLDCDRSAERSRAAAVAKIQERLGLGEGGGLSLAQDAPESGALSTATLDSGQLRIADSKGEER